MSEIAEEIGCLVIAAIIFCIPIMVYRFITSGDDFLIWIGCIVGIIMYLILCVYLEEQTKKR